MSPNKLYFFALGLLTALAQTTAKASEEPFWKKIAQDPRACQISLTPSSPLRDKVLSQFMEFRETIRKDIEVLSESHDVVVGDYKPVLTSSAPKLSQATLKRLTQAFAEGSPKGRSPEKNAQAFELAKRSVEGDPYFIWLTKKTGADAARIFLTPLRAIGSEHLPLSLALARVQAMLDPSYSVRAKGIVSMLLQHHARLWVIDQEIEAIQSLSSKPESAWLNLKTLEEATEQRRQLLAEVRKSGEANGMPQSTFEKLQLLFDAGEKGSQDSEVLRRYILTSEKQRALEKEVELIREKYQLPKNLHFDRNLLAVWPAMLNRESGYERFVLTAGFYQPLSERSSIAFKLDELDSVIDAALNVRSDRSLRRYTDYLINHKYEGRFTTLN